MLLEAMREMNEKLKATILMVTHDSFSASFCKRVIFIKDGKVFNEIIKGEKHDRNNTSNNIRNSPRTNRIIVQFQVQDIYT